MRAHGDEDARGVALLGEVWEMEMKPHRQFGRDQIPPALDNARKNDGVVVLRDVYLCNAMGVMLSNPRHKMEVPG